MSSGSTGSTGGGSIRVLTMNILARHADWPARREVLARGIRDLQPDLIALQETVVTGDEDQVTTFLDSDYHILHSRERHRDGTGISIASRWPVIAVDEIDLHITPRTKPFPCSALVVEVAVPDPIGPLLFVNHFPDYQPDREYERELQTVAVARHVEQQVEGLEKHVILAGDLDAEPDAASLRFLAGRQSLEGMSVCYRSAWEWANPGMPAHTFTERNPLMGSATAGWPFSQIDHIFIRCGEQGWPTLQIASCDLAFAEAVDGVWASDHIGVVADFTVRQPANAALHQDPGFRESRKGQA